MADLFPFEYARIRWRQSVLDRHGAKWLTQFARIKEQNVGPELELQFLDWLNKNVSNLSQ